MPISIKLNPPRNDGKGGLIYYFPAGCGKCLPCLMKRKAQWSYRIQAEARKSFSSYFVTLTYDDKHLPLGENGSSANNNDHKLFIKNLNKLESKEVLSKRKMVSSEEWSRISKNAGFEGDLKYYGCIEYGGSSGRVHLHYILLNVRDTNNINMAWTDKPIKALKKKGYEVENVGNSMGRIQVDECNINTIDYVLKYMVKDHSGKDYSGRDKEKAFMSKGFGLSIVDAEFKKYIKKPDANLVVNDRGRKIGLPRYYRKKYLTDLESNKKIAYIRDTVDTEKQKRETELEREGRSIYKVDILNKEKRRTLLNKNKKRELR